MTGFITADGADYMMRLFAGVEEVASSYYLALVTEPVGTTESGSELTEPDFGDYYRAPVPLGPENWYVAYGSMTNINQIAVAQPSTDEWTGIIGWAICDSDSGGRILYAGDEESFSIGIGEQLYLPAGSVTLAIEQDGWREVT